LPDNPIAFCFLGDTYDAMRLDQEAAENYQRALAIDPDDETAKKRWRRWQMYHGPES